MGARCHRPGRVKGLGKDRLSQYGPGKRRILHLDILQIGATQHKMRQVKAAQMPALLLQQREQICRSIPLRVVSPLAQVIEQGEQPLL